MSELSDLKLCSAIRKTRRPPNQPTAARTAITINDQTPASDDVNSSNTLLNQIEATIGATPSNKAGRITSEIQAVANFVMLISANREPSSESSERRFELDASSSMSPRRGSIAGFKRRLWTRATSQSPLPHTLLRGKSRHVSLLQSDHTGANLYHERPRLLDTSATASYSVSCLPIEAYRHALDLSDNHWIVSCCHHHFRSAKF